MIYTDGIHLIASEGINELHKFAKDIDLNKCWFHESSRHPHYDLYSGRNKNNRAFMLQKAIQFGAIKTDSRNLVKISRATYFLPETDEEVELSERKNKWELNRPLTQKEIDTQKDMKAYLFNKLFGDCCGGAKCQVPNCEICKGEIY